MHHSQLLARSFNDKNGLTIPSCLQTSRIIKANKFLYECMTGALQNILNHLKATAKPFLSEQVQPFKLRVWSEPYTDYMYYWSLNIQKDRKEFKILQWAKLSNMWHIWKINRIFIYIEIWMYWTHLKNGLKCNVIKQSVIMCSDVSSWAFDQ